MLTKILLLACLATVQSAAVCTGKSVGLPAKECAAWQDFFDNLNGVNWKNFGSDGRSDPCSVKSKIGDPCKGGPTVAAMPKYDLGTGPPPWQEPDAGVCCQDGHITQMAFALNNLAGTVPASINDMEELINFSACNNALNGTLPDMSNTKMQFLRLSSNQLIGGPVTGMTDLTFLSLRDNAIVGPAPDLSAMTKLTDLYLDCNHYSGALPAVYGTMKFSGKCFIDASTLLEKCSADFDNTFSCPLPAGASTECHAICK